MYQPELGSESRDLHTGAVPGNEAMPRGRMGKLVEETLLRGPRWLCQNGISDSQEDGRNQGGFLYNDQRLTAEKGAVRCQLGRWEEGGVGVAVTEQRDEDEKGRGRGM